MKKIPLVLLALVLTGCAARMTQAEFFGDPRDSLTVQREHPKMFARPDTTVGDYEGHLRRSAARRRYARHALAVVAERGLRRGRRVHEGNGVHPEVVRSGGGRGGRWGDLKSSTRRSTS